MELDLNTLKPQERVSLQLRLLYEKAGFRISGAPIRQTTGIGEGEFYHMIAE